MKHESYNQFIPALQRRLSDVVAEYDVKHEALNDRLADFTRARSDLVAASSIGADYVGFSLKTGDVAVRDMADHLLKSAWLYVYSQLKIDIIASADDRRRFKMSMENPAPFTLDNIRATFGRYILDPRANILRGLAEVFCALDPYYRSHDRVKIGVAGLPKRIILRNVGGFSSYGYERLLDALNALATYRGHPLIEHSEMGPISDLYKLDGHRAGVVEIRGLTIKKHQNGNAHVHFDKASLRDINMALAEFYGDVLPDTPDERPERPQPGTEVARDLSYYPTPDKVIRRIFDNLYAREGQKLLDPSCGDGRILAEARRRGLKPMGVEVDERRAQQAREIGVPVLWANFLVTAPNPVFDHVVMNPPFYGRHYAKHVSHAMKFLRPGGKLTAILPATARYDHGLLQGSWDDLPVGSFSESGTNINTVVLTKYAPEEE